MKQPYTGRYHPFRDSDIEVKFKWRPCAPGAPTFPVPHCIYNPIYDDDSDAAPQDEVRYCDIDRSTFRQNFAKPIPFGLGDHYCGSVEDWKIGPKFDATAHFPKNDNGLPICCALIVAFGGGLAVGGNVPIKYANLLNVSGGIAVGGSVAVSRKAILEVSGGIAAGGNVPIRYAHLLSVTGGIEVGGSVQVLGTNTLAVTGGIEVGGDVEITATSPPPPPGTDCATAPLLSLGVDYALPTTIGVNQYVRWSVSPSTTYHVTYTTDSLLVATNLKDGVFPVCSADLLVPISGCNTFTTNPGIDTVWFVWFDFFPPSHTVNLRVDPGPC